MEKRLIGVVLTAIGVIALIIAAYYFINDSGTQNSIDTILGVIGMIFFFAGVGQVTKASDKAM